MKKVRLAACAVALTVGGLTPLGLSPAAADPATTAAAAGYGLNLDVAGTTAVNKAGGAVSTLPPGGVEGPNDLVLVPVEPVTLAGTARGVAATSAASTLPSLLEEVTQPVPGPYNARGVGQVEDLGVLLEAGVDPVTIEQALVSADAVRGEAVGVCRGGQALYSANSEIVNLEIGGEPLGLNAPITDLLGTINDVLAPLEQVVDIDLNVVTPSANGIAVDALRVRVLNLTGDPLVDIRIGHAEVAALQCPRVPQCSNTTDDDGDGVIDANDPGCITNGVYDPNDDDERNECVDGIDNADPEDSLADFGNDPGCADAQDDDETNGPGGLGDALPRTGGDASTTVPMAGGLALLALGALALRRRSQASS